MPDLANRNIRFPVQFQFLLCSQSCLILCDHMDRLLCPLDFSGKNTGVGCHFLLQGIFLTQGLNLHLPCLLHCKQILNLLSHQRSPISNNNEYFFFLSINVSCAIQLTLEQHRFELHKSTYMQIFFNSEYDSTTSSEVG